MTVLKAMIENPDDHDFKNNPFEYDEAQKFLKQMEVESINHMDNDEIRKQVRCKLNNMKTYQYIIFYYCYALLIKPHFQMSKHKNEFDKVRREMRKLQQKYNKKSMYDGENDIELGEIGKK